MNCNNTRSCCSPYSVLAQQLEETTERAIQAYNLAAAALTNPVNGLTVDGDLQVNGDILQNGSTYETHAEKVYTNDDYIIMRDGAVSALSAGDYSGFQVTKYDGTNDGRLVIDNAGTARVGDVGDEQPLATRDESADLTDGHLVKWDAVHLKLVDGGSPADLGLQFMTEISDSKTVSYPDQKSTTSISLPSGVSFEEGYDYLIMFYTAPSTADVGVRLVNDYALDGDTSFGIYFNSAESEFYYNVNVYRMAASDPTQIKLYMEAPSRLDVQEKLVSGTNIKTVGGQSILGSGDIPAGGLTWTERTANNDWTDIFDFDVNLYKMTAKKHIYMYSKSDRIQIYIPKGFITDNLYLYAPRVSISSNNIKVYDEILIAGNKLGSSYTTFTKTHVGVTLTTDGSSISIASDNTSDQLYKANIRIWIAD